MNKPALSTIRTACHGRHIRQPSVGAIGPRDSNLEHISYTPLPPRPANRQFSALPAAPLPRDPAKPNRRRMPPAKSPQKVLYRVQQIVSWVQRRLSRPDPLHVVGFTKIWIGTSWGRPSWGASEAVLGSSWGGSWTVRLGGASWVLLGHLGHFLGRLEPMLAHPENMFVVCLGAFRTSQEPSDWGLVARALAPSHIKHHCPHQIHS